MTPTFGRMGPRPKRNDGVPAYASSAGEC
jgi:hypothetical protein